MAAGDKPVVGVVLGLGLTVVSTTVMALLNVHGGGYVTRAAAFGTLPWRIALSALVGVYSPVVQELAFRGLLLQGLLQRMNAGAAVGVSSALFGVAHAANGIASVIDTFAFGVLAGVLFVRFRSLAAPVASHIAVNSVAMIYLIWALQRSGWPGGTAP